MPALKKLTKKPTEREMWKRITGALHHHGCRAYRIESTVTPGFPDIVWVTENGVRLMELKAGKIKFRQAQIKFIKDAHATGVTVWIIHQRVQRGEMKVLTGIVAIEGGPEEGMRMEEWLGVMTND